MGRIWRFGFFQPFFYLVWFGAKKRLNKKLTRRKLFETDPGDVRTCEPDNGLVKKEGKNSHQHPDSQ